MQNNNLADHFMGLLVEIKNKNPEVVLDDNQVYKLNIKFEIKKENEKRAMKIKRINLRKG